MSIPLRNGREHSPQASDQTRPRLRTTPRLSIWFFVGALSLIYGLVLLPLGVYQIRHPPAVVRADLHATLWWGVLMICFGGFYTIRFRP